MSKLPAELVIDASCVVKWFTSELNTEQALRLLTLHKSALVTLFAPDLLVYEVVNALRYKPDITDSLLQRWTRNLFDLQLNLVPPTIDLLSSAATLAFQHGTTIYDSLYLALSEKLGIKFVSADTRFIEKVNQPERILNLGDLSS